ncbi:MAG TPA: DoxX family membrane protein [Thermoanaerobaculia bacterium]|nr:DoxX family membrane protein [Thermoanaerobaculia bacterium]
MIAKSTLGRLFFAISMVASGVQQLITGDFVRLVPPLPAWIPWHSFWAYLVGVVLIVAGAAIGLGRGVRWAAAVLGAMIILAFLLLHLPRALSDPLVGFMWTNPFKALAMLGGTIILAGILPEEDSGISRLFRRLMPLGSVLLGGFLLLGGVQHFVYADFVAQLVPSWIPGTRFWVYFTGVALIAGGMGLFIPKTARLAATMSGIMMLLWVVMLHIPRALADLSKAGETAGVFEALALSGVAFMLADLRRAAKPAGQGPTADR